MNLRSLVSKSRMHSRYTYSLCTAQRPFVRLPKVSSFANCSQQHYHGKRINSSAAPLKNALRCFSTPVQKKLSQQPARTPHMPKITTSTTPLSQQMHHGKRVSSVLNNAPLRCFSTPVQKKTPHLQRGSVSTIRPTLSSQVHSRPAILRTLLKPCKGSIFAADNAGTLHLREISQSAFLLKEQGEEAANAPASKNSNSAQGEEVKTEQEQQGGEKTQTQREFWANLLGSLGALANWGIPVAAIAAILSGSDPEKINIPLTATLVLYSSLFVRWSIAIHPRNYLLFLCHIFNLVGQTTQLGRGILFQTTGYGKASAQVEEKKCDLQENDSINDEDVVE